MPFIYDEDTREEDYVDPNLLPEIKMNPVNLVTYSVQEEQWLKKQVSFHLGYEEESEEIVLSAHFVLEDGSIEIRTHNLDRVEFEKSLSNLVRSNTSKRLEEDFLKPVIDGIVDAFIRGKRKKDRQFYVRPSQEYTLSGGIGFIVDKATNEEVGVFESLVFTHDERPKFTIFDYTLSVVKERYLLERSKSFWFQYYDVSDHLVYTLLPKGEAESRRERSLILFDFVPAVDHFGQDHEKWDTVIQVQEEKEQFKGLDDEERSESLIEFRLNLLKQSQERCEKERLLKQFADIDFD